MVLFMKSCAKLGQKTELPLLLSCRIEYILLGPGMWVEGYTIVIFRKVIEIFYENSNSLSLMDFLFFVVLA